MRNGWVARAKRKVIQDMENTFNGCTKKEWVYDMGCELSNLLAGEYPDDGAALSYGVRSMLTELEELVAHDLQVEREEERLAAVPDEMVQRWASLRDVPHWREDTRTGA